MRSGCRDLWGERSPKHSRRATRPQSVASRSLSIALVSSTGPRVERILRFSRGIPGYCRLSSDAGDESEIPLDIRPVAGLLVLAVHGRSGAICVIPFRRGPDHNAGGASIVNANA